MAERAEAFEPAAVVAERVEALAARLRIFRMAALESFQARRDRVERAAAGGDGRDRAFEQRDEGEHVVEATRAVGAFELRRDEAEQRALHPGPGGVLRLGYSY